MIRTALSLAALAASALLPAAAQVSATQAVLAETVTVDDQGRETVRTVPATEVTPGDRIAYVLSYRNEGAAPADGLVLVMPVPGTVDLLVGTEAGGRADYSVDGGQTYAALAELTVTGEDGRPRPAGGRDVTHLRWRLEGALPPGEAGEVSYRAVLR